METKWKDMHVDLAKLSASVQEYFAKKDFTADVSKSDEEFRILVKPKTHHKILERIQVTINGNPNSFSVKLSATTRSRSFIIFGTLTTLLGGGLFSSKGLKSDESLEKVEKDFRMFVAEKVWELRNAA